MKHRPFLLLCPLLFAAGAGAAWLVPANRSSGVSTRKARPDASPPVTSTAAFVPGIPTGPGIPEPSGLPGDILHLTAIGDTRTLRAAWPEADDAARELLVDRWLELDPGDGIRFLLAEPVNGMPRDSTLAAELAWKWDQRDRRGFLRFLAALPGEVPLLQIWGGEFRFFWDRPFRALTPDEGLALYHQGGAGFKKMAAQPVFRMLADQNPARALEEIQRLPPASREAAWEGAANADDPGAVLRLLREHPPAGCSLTSWEQLFAGYCNKEPEAARALAESLPPGQAREDACQEVALLMAKKDPGAAFEWMEDHSPSNENRIVLLNAMADSNPDRSLELTIQHQLDLPPALEEHLENLAHENWEAAQARALKTPAGRTRSQMITAMAEALSFEDTEPLPLLEKLSQLLTAAGGSESRGKAQKLPDAFLRRMNPAQLPEVTEWVSGQPAPVREALMAPLLGRMESESPESALSWLAQNPPSRTRTGLLLGKVVQWTAQDPQAAADFVLRLPEGTERDYAILNTAAAWQDFAPGAARQWVETLPDSPAKIRAAQQLEQTSRPAN